MPTKESDKTSVASTIGGIVLLAILTPIAIMGVAAVAWIVAMLWDNAFQYIEYVWRSVGDRIYGA